MNRARILQQNDLISSNRIKQDKLAEELQEMDVEMGLVSINPRYSPLLIRDQALATPQDTAQTAARVVEIVWRLGTFFARLRWDDWTGSSDLQDTIKKRAAELRETLEVLGPSFIKAGQVLANRPDIVRQDYMEELCVLQDDVPPYPDEEAFALIEQNLGRPLEEVLSSISERPIAAASLGQVYKGVLRESGEEVAIKVQRPRVEPIIVRDLFIFRAIAQLINPIARRRLGCNAALIVDEFGEKLMEELDYELEARNIQDFHTNFDGDPLVKIPWVRRDLSGRTCLIMEWIDGIRCTDPAAIHASSIDVDAFIRIGVMSGLRQLLEFGLFHGDPHPGNIFALRDGRIAYVDFGNVAQLSQYNKQVLIDAVVHAVNKDYKGMAGDFIKLGFLEAGTDVAPIVPALEKIWADSMGQSLKDFNFRTVTSKFNELVYQYPIRVPERYSLVIRSLLTQEGICMTLDPNFYFLEVAYPYVAKRLLTDPDPALRDRLLQVLFSDGKFQWERLENLVSLAKEGGGNDLDLSETAKDALRILLLDTSLRTQLVAALTEDNRLHIQEVMSLLDLLKDDLDVQRIARNMAADFPSLSRQLILSWSDRVLSQ